jgi:hypothetical protein
MLRYVIGVNQNTKESSDEVPFLLRWSARQYARRFPPGRPVIIRVSPTQSSETRLFAIDQE